MPRFMAVHTLPMTEEQAVQTMMNPPQAQEGITCLYTYCDFADGKFFCDWEGPSKEVIEQTLRTLQMPFDVVYPVRKLDWAKQVLEAAPKAVATV